jgi:hypothetical protein
MEGDPTSKNKTKQTEEHGKNLLKIPLPASLHLVAWNEREQNLGFSLYALLFSTFSLKP